MTHTERIQAIATEMAQEHLTTNAWSYASISLQNWTIESMGGKARIAVKNMTDVVRKILSANHSEEYITGWLISEGLIPDNGQDTDCSIHSGNVDMI